jgi:hypothetical protein
MIPKWVKKPNLFVEEMQLAFQLATHLADPFVARALARRVLVRGRISTSMRGASAGRSTTRAMTCATFTRPRKPNRIVATTTKWPEWAGINGATIV